MPDKEEILGRLRSLRGALSLSQEFVASALGIDRTTYVRKEQGRIPITTEEWVAIAEALGVEPAHFFSGAPNEVRARELTPAEVQMARLYGALAPDERKDLVTVLTLMLKGIRRRGVVEALERIRSAGPTGGFGPGGDPGV